MLGKNIPPFISAPPSSYVEFYFYFSGTPSLTLYLVVLFHMMLPPSVLYTLLLFPNCSGRRYTSLLFFSLFFSFALPLTPLFPSNLHPRSIHNPPSPVV